MMSCGGSGGGGSGGGDDSSNAAAATNDDPDECPALPFVWMSTLGRWGQLGKHSHPPTHMRPFYLPAHLQSF
jgi:hypothetical protein